MITQWLTAQLGMIIFIYCFARLHAPVNEAFTQYIPIRNPFEDEFHGMAVVVATMVIIILCADRIAVLGWWVILLGFVLASVYALAFDPFLNMNVTGRSWAFLGGSATTDRFWKRNFGKHAGEYKFVLLTLLVIVLNLFFFIAK